MTEIDSIIQKYLSGETSEEENRQLLQWIQESPENKKRLFAEKDIWDTYSFHTNQKEYETDQELKILQSQLGPRISQHAITLKKALQMAAILLIAFGLGWSSRFISFSSKQQTAQANMQEIFVPKGQVNQVFLADGTRIWINSESRLIAPSTFASKERVVKLSGEAFFEVAKDYKRPFRVEVNGQQIEVLGTSFNVRAYENSGEIETTLETGQIKLSAAGQTTLLLPGEQSLFDKTSKQLKINRVDPRTISAWKNGRYEFQNENLPEVFKVVERWYDVEIDANDDSFRDMHFSGVIKRNKDVGHFLDLLNHTIPIQYKIDGDKIKISSK